MWALWLLALLVGAGGQQFSHFPVTSGRSDAWTAPVGRPPGREAGGSKTGSTEELMSLLEEEGDEGEVRTVRGRVLNGPQSHSVSGPPVKSVSVGRSPAQTGGRFRPTSDFPKVVKKEEEVAAEEKESDKPRLRTRTRFRPSESRPRLKEQENVVQEKEDGRDRARTRGRPFSSRSFVRPLKEQSNQVTKPETTTTLAPVTPSATKNPKRGRGGVPRRVIGQNSVTTEGFFRAGAAPTPLISSPFRDETNERPKHKTNQATRRITIKRPKNGTPQTNNTNLTNVKENETQFLPTMPPKRRKGSRKSFPKSSSRRPFPIKLESSIPARENSSNRRFQPINTLSKLNRKPVSNIERSTRAPARLITTTEAPVTRAVTRASTPTTSSTTTTTTTTTATTTTTTRVPITTRKLINADTRRRPALSLSESFTRGPPTRTTTTSPEQVRSPTPKLAVAVGVEEPTHFAPEDEAPSVLSPLNNVLSIVSMRKDTESDHEDVMVAAYDIEKALSHAELTWAADPFRKLAPQGKPDFDIDFGKNPARSREAPRPLNALHATPVGRAPVQPSFTRHLGIVETEPSANNRLRKSFADEEAARESTSTTSSPAPRRVNTGFRGRAPPSKVKADAQQFASNNLKQSPTEKPASPPQPARQPNIRGRGRSSHNTLNVAVKTIEDKLETRDDPSAIQEPLSNVKTTKIEDLLWTPALLQKSFDKDQLSINSKQPQNPDDLFVFFRS